MSSLIPSVRMQTPVSSIVFVTSALVWHRLFVRTRMRGIGIPRGGVRCFGFDSFPKGIDDHVSCMDHSTSTHRSIISFHDTLDERSYAFVEHFYFVPSVPSIHAIEGVGVFGAEDHLRMRHPFRQHVFLSASTLPSSTHAARVCLVLCFPAHFASSSHLLSRGYHVQAFSAPLFQLAIHEWSDHHSHLHGDLLLVLVHVHVRHCSGHGATIHHHVFVAFASSSHRLGFPTGSKPDRNRIETGPVRVRNRWERDRETEPCRRGPSSCRRVWFERSSRRTYSLGFQGGRGTGLRTPQGGRMAPRGRQRGR